MLSTGQTGNTQERNLGAGIGPQTGLRITSKDRFYTNSFTIKWHTGGMTADQYQLTIGTVSGGADLYTSTVFDSAQIDADDEQVGQWTVTDIDATVAWVTLAYRYGDGEFRFARQQIYIDTYIIPVLTWDDDTRWDDTEAWSE